jgi:3-keto-5-aminohexanoate cleavage enzyme
MEKLIITAAVTGSITTRENNPNIPYTPEEIAQAAIESYEVGAAVVHLHVRELLTGKPVQDAVLFKKVIRLIRQKCDMIICVSTGGGPNMTYDERIQVIPILSAEPDTKPELASLNAGSLNFGVYSKKNNAFLLDNIQSNAWGEIIRFARIMGENGVQPEVEIYDAAMINNARLLVEMGVLKAPLHFNFVFGVIGGLQPTIENLAFLRTSAPQDSTWCVSAVGLDIFRIGPVAIASGGHVRVGMEDGTHVSKGRQAKSNAELVEKIARFCKEMDREVASVDEARRILHLPK